jgi:hypothetical protein
MLKNLTITILARNSNSKGDIFTWAMGDFFSLLGYEKFKFNIHKTGRELDVQASHKTENRIAIAECKAHEEPIGGDFVNKFAGILDLERRKYSSSSVEGYFISLSGLKPTAEEQEAEVNPRRMIIINGAEVVERLIEAKIICHPSVAISAAKVLVPEGYVLTSDLQIYLTEHGWVWGLQYSKGHQKIGHTLIHADGQPIAANIAKEIIELEIPIGGKLGSLEYYAPPDTLGDEMQALHAYLTACREDCGQIQLEGLPADNEVGSKRLDLERLYVPLFVLRKNLDAEGIEWEPEREETGSRSTAPRKEDVQNALAVAQRMAILALPGAGKSTLLKKIVMENSKAILEHTSEARIPILLRCRIVSNPNRPLLDIICDTFIRMVPTGSADAFRRVIKSGLVSGRILILIDGLDEITDDGERIAFAAQVRQFVSVYPSLWLIVTSRIAGFRVVAGSLNTITTLFQLAEFSNSDIRMLTMSWYREVVGTSDVIQEQAEALAQSICNTDRVRILAKNPLLLTTLLLVKRWVGELPSRRSVLYGKAIEVLLMTWNVEGHAKLELDEVLPQLCYVAYSMMEMGLKRVSQTMLHELLTGSLNEMPEIRDFVSLSPSQLIERVELRSSLLVNSGQIIEDGRLQPVYEFRHLTFQEYLTAVAVVEGTFPGHNAADEPFSALTSHIGDEAWKEVVPLAAVLAGRKAPILIHNLIVALNAMPEEDDVDSYQVTPATHLAACLYDEVQIASTLAEEAIESLIRHGFTFERYSLDREALLSGRFGNLLRGVSDKMFFEPGLHLLSAGGIVSEIEFSDSGGTEVAIARAQTLLESQDPHIRIHGALLAMQIAYDKYSDHDSHEISHLELAARPMLFSKDTPSLVASCWFYAWYCTTHNSVHNPEELTLRLIEIWYESENTELSYVSAWAFTRTQVLDRNTFKTEAPNVEWHKKMYNPPNIAPYRKQSMIVASLLSAFYSGSVWSDPELAELIEAQFGMSDPGEQTTLKSMLAGLGAPGNVVLGRLKETEKTIPGVKSERPIRRKKRVQP